MIFLNPVFNLSTDLCRDLARVIGLALGYKPIVVIGARVAFFAARCLACE